MGGKIPTEQANVMRVGSETQKRANEGRDLTMTSKQYTDVEELVRDTAGKEFAERFAQYADERKLVTQLVAIRGATGLSQKEVADRMKCSQSRVSKLEGSVDREIRFGDIIDYAKANGFSVTLILAETPSSLVAQIRYYALQIKRLLDRLIGLVRDDADMAKGAAKFCGEIVYNVARFAQQAAQKLPVQAEDGTPAVTIEVDTQFARENTDSPAASTADCAEDSCEAAVRG